MFVDFLCILMWDGLIYCGFPVAFGEYVGDLIVVVDLVLNSELQLHLWHSIVPFHVQSMSLYIEHPLILPSPQRRGHCRIMTGSRYHSSFFEIMYVRVRKLSITDNQPNISAVSEQCVLCT